ALRPGGATLGLPRLSHADLISPLPSRDRTGASRMPSNRRRLLETFVATCLLAAPAFAADPPPAYQDTNRSFEDRAADLVSRMTLEEKIAQLQNDRPAIPRLGIPSYEWWNEALHGVARSGAATVFPQAIGLAATFDTRLMHEVSTVIGDEG